MKKLLLSFLLSLALLLPTGTATSQSEEEAVKLLEPIITSNEAVPLGQKSLFSAKGSKLLENSEGVPRYTWNFGDGGVKWGSEVFYQYQKPGQYNVELKLRQGRNNKTIRKTVTVYTKKGLLISQPNQATKELIDQASENGVWLNAILFEKEQKGLSGEVEFTKKLAEKVEFLKEADYVIFQTNSGAAFQVFSQWWQSRLPENKFSLQDKTWVQLSTGSIAKTMKLIESVFPVLNPDQIFITRISALNTLFEEAPANFAEELTRRGIDFKLIDGKSKTSFLLFFSRLTNYFTSHGIAQSVLYILLSVPFIVFVVSFFRQFVGISTFGVFAPLVLTLSFMILGLKFGFTVFVVVMAVSYLIRLIFDKVELLYIPKVSLLFSALAISFFFVLGIAVYFDTSIDLALAVFPMMVMSTVSEKFISAQSEEGIKNALISAGETVLVSFLAFLLVRWDLVEDSVLSFPELIVFPILGNIWLGKFTGLRLSEYFKFRSILRGDEEQEE